MLAHVGWVKAKDADGADVLVLPDAADLELVKAVVDELEDI